MRVGQSGAIWILPTKLTKAKCSLCISNVISLNVHCLSVSPSRFPPQWTVVFRYRVLGKLRCFPTPQNSFWLHEWQDRIRNTIATGSIDESTDQSLANKPIHICTQGAVRVKIMLRHRSEKERKIYAGNSGMTYFWASNRPALFRTELSVFFTERPRKRKWERCGIGMLTIVPRISLWFSPDNKDA